MDIGIELNKSIQTRIFNTLKELNPSIEGTQDEVLHKTSIDDILAALAYTAKTIYFSDISNISNKKVIEKFPAEEIRDKYITPIRICGTIITVACINPFDSRVDAIIASTYKEELQDKQPVIQKIITTKSNILKLSSNSKKINISQKELESVESFEKVEELVTLDLERTPDDTVFKLIHKIFKEAVDTGTSDIHIRCDLDPNTSKDTLYYHYRIDGALGEKEELGINLKERLDAALINQLPGVNPEDRNVLPGISGRLALSYQGRIVNIRYERTKTYRGYHITMRLLDKDGFEPKLGTPSMPFPKKTEEWIKSVLEIPVGIIVMSGPTGSGKSTTLNAMIREINRPDVSILTLENPVEDEIPGVIHHQMRNANEFNNYIKSFMRADPDKILIGEVRDKETAELAVEAAITGHQVLTTAHVNSASLVIDRFEQLGIEKFKIAQALAAAIAQRLVKKLCDNCKLKQVGIEPRHIKLYRLHSIKEINGKPVNWEENEFFIKNQDGCAQCNNTGYKGRIPILEIIPVDKQIRAMLMDNAKPMEIEIYAHKTYNLPSLKDEGLRLIQEGVSDIDSVAKSVDLIF